MALPLVPPLASVLDSCVSTLLAHPLSLPTDIPCSLPLSVSISLSVSVSLSVSLPFSLPAPPILYPTTVATEPSGKHTSTTTALSYSTRSSPFPQSTSSLTTNTPTTPSQPTQSTLPNSLPTTSLFTTIPWNPQNASTMSYTLSSGVDTRGMYVDPATSSGNTGPSVTISSGSSGTGTLPWHCGVQCLPLVSSVPATAAFTPYVPWPTQDSGNNGKDHPLRPRSRISTGVILAISLGGLAILICIILVAIFLQRRVRRRARRISVDSARWHLRPHSYDSDGESDVAYSSICEAVMLMRMHLGRLLYREF